MSSLERPRVEYRTPEDLVREVQAGVIRIPEFQRGFRWEASDIVKLFDSILRGYPIGNLLLWVRPAPARTLHIGPLTVSAPAREAALWVVDGQQRITSLVGALAEAHKSTDPRFRVHLDLDTGEFHTAGLRQQPPRTWLPVSVLIDTATLLRWMRANAEWLDDDRLDLADRAAKALREYQIPTYVVTSTSQEPLLEIFTRMNTTGKQLTKPEVFQALHAGASADEPRSLHSLGQVTARAGFGQLDDRLALRCVLAFRGGDVFREEFADEFDSDDDAATTFRDIAAALREAAEFLRGTGIPHAKLLPYSHPLFVLVRFIRLHGRPEGRAATLLRRWVWRGAVAGTRARGTSVSDVRDQVTAVDAATPLAAATTLLRQVQQFPDFQPELDKIHFSHAMTKLNVLGLLSAEPVDPVTSEPVDIARLLDHGSPLRTISTATSGRLGNTMANRVVMPPAAGRTVAQLLARSDDALARSHLVDGPAQRLLATGETDAFLRRRHDLVAEAIRGHVARMAEWGARDGQSMTDLLRSVA